MKKWFCSVATEFVEGCADGFLVTSGGASVATAVAQAAAVSPLQLLCSVLLCGVWYVASFVKKNPPPFGADSPQPSALSAQQQPPSPPSSAT